MLFSLYFALFEIFYVILHIIFRLFSRDICFAKQILFMQIHPNPQQPD